MEWVVVNCFDSFRFRKHHHARHCLGDAIDSNGSLLFRGGEFYVQGPSSSANASIDTDGDAYFDGGEIIALDGGQMTELPNSNSQQCVLVYSGLSITKNQELKVIDSENVTLMSIIPNKSYTSLYMSSYKFNVGNTYTIYSGTTKLNEVTLTGTSNSRTGSLTLSGDNRRGLVWKAEVDGTGGTAVITKLIITYTK